MPASCQLSHPDTDVPFHEEHVLQCERNLSCIRVLPARRLPSHPDTGAPLQDERVNTVREELNLQPELYLRNVTNGMRSHQNVPTMCQRVFWRWLKWCRNPRTQCSLFLGLVFDPSAMKNVDLKAGLMPSSDSTFTYERNERLFIEMSMVADYDADADLLVFFLDT